MTFTAPAELPSTLPLSELDKVRWSELSHAYGPATDVPKLISDLASKKVAKRNEALTELQGNIIHQGTVYTATPYAVPFLVELMITRQELRTDLLDILQWMAFGFEEAVFPDGFPLTTFLEEQVRANTQPNPYGIDVVNTHLSVARASEQITSLLDDIDAEVRSEAAHLLAYLPSAGTTSIASLQERLSPSMNETVEASFLLALGVLGRQLGIDPEITGHLTTSQASRIAAICARSLTGDREMIEPLVDLLSSDLPRLGNWLDGSTVTVVCSSISVHDEWLTPRLIDPLGRQLRTMPPFQKPWVAGLLLKELFANDWPPPESSEHLSELQRDALGLLVASDGWTINGAKNSNWSMQIAEFLLPSSKADLQRYVDGEDLSVCIGEVRQPQLKTARLQANSDGKGTEQ